MEINRNNYEEFFLLYVDGELNAVERDSVEKFAEQHVDLQEELNALLQTKLSVADEMIFENKHLLYKYESDIINSDNYQEYLLCYIDNELNSEDKKLVEKLVENNPGKKAELEILQRAKLDKDEKIVFENKASLFRTEKEKVRILPFYWMRFAAAASVILIAGAIWWTIADEEETDQIKVVAQTQNNISPSVETKKENTVDTGNSSVDLARQTKEQPRKEASSNEILISGKDKSVDKSPVEVATNDKKLNPIVKATTVNQQENTVPDKGDLTHENVNTINEKVNSNITATVKPTVKPVIIDQAAFNGSDEKRDVAVVTAKTDDTVEYLDTDNTDKKSKGKFRGLFRKASRLIGRVTDADKDENQSIVRVASFEIAKK